MSWQARAACGGTVAQLFFGPDGERSQDRETREANAVAVCARCPVRAQCLDYALMNSIKHGIWGGLNKEERARERRRRAGKAARCVTVMDAADVRRTSRAVQTRAYGGS